MSLRPHPPGDILFLGADGVGVDGGGGELGVAEPLLHWVERNAGRDRGHPEAVPQPLGEVCGPDNPAASMTPCTARQPVIRLQGQSRTPRPLPRLP